MVYYEDILGQFLFIAKFSKRLTPHYYNNYLRKIEISGREIVLEKSGDSKKIFYQSIKK